MSEPQTVPPAWRRQVPSPELACKDNSHSDHQPSFITFFLSSWHDGPALHTQPALHMPSTSPAPRRSGNSILSRQPRAASCDEWKAHVDISASSLAVWCLPFHLSSENVGIKRKKGNIIKIHQSYKSNKTASRVGFLGSSIPSRKPCQKPHLVHESFDGPRHALGREPGWAWWGGREGRIHCYHPRHGDGDWLHKIQTIGKYLNTNVLLCSLHVAATAARPKGVNFVSIYAKLFLNLPYRANFVDHTILSMPILFSS